ncbi:sodium/solute symporter [Hellea sp.]|nr:sodium/solute symporter [Hellea sp.]MDA8888955.1 sodium/solute symporter [Hellea sp.]MDB4845433.1 sodium/solute symporter [Hellea sp.]MDC0422555.1 sodium/solute symporter [Hellea sp.]MDC1088569.1 sodium/solute symporter [Hellea sp.]
MQLELIQIIIFISLLLAIAVVTVWYCLKSSSSVNQEKEYFLAGGSLKWYFVAGSITLTNLSTDQLVGMNGNQMALLAWWELAAVAGLCMLCFIFIPIYYKYNCTTTTELLEIRYKNKHIRALVSLLFLLGNIFIFLPAILYGGSLFIQSMFNVDINLYVLAILFAGFGAAYSIFGGLRAVAISDTFSGVLLLGLAITVTLIALNTINFDLSGIPKERLTLIGTPDSDIPFSTLFTGMVFIQMFYWSTNQTITQRAMASPSVKEAQKGILAAAIIRLLIVPPIIVIPGIVAYKLYGDIGDAAYGTLVGDLLPSFLSGAFAAAIVAAVLTTFNSILNASAALWVCDIHKTYISKNPNVKKLSLWVSIIMVIMAFMMIPIFNNPEQSIINTVQRLYGLLSMPILAAFIVGLLFKNIDARSVIISVIFGVIFYYWMLLPLAENASMETQNVKFHYIHLMAINLLAMIIVSLSLNKFMFRENAQWDLKSLFRADQK